MEHTKNSPHPFEPSQNELPPKSEYHFELDRRKFFQLSGGGLVVVFVLKDLFSLAGENASPQPLDNTHQVSAWIRIGEDGKVQVFTGKVEVGQNIRTSLSQIVAEELKAPISSIEMIMGGYGFGSLRCWHLWQPYYSANGYSIAKSSSYYPAGIIGYGC